MAKEEEKKEECCDPKHHKMHKGYGGMGGGVYGLAFLGALVYFIQHSDTFWMGVLGFFKAIAWPAMIVYKVLGIFGL